MTTAWSIFLTILPYILQVLGVFMGYQGIQNSHLAKSGQYSPTQVNLYGPGQAVAGGTLFVAGLGLHAYQGHKAAAVPVKPPGPAPLPINSNDPTIQTLTNLEKQINDDRDAKIAAINAETKDRIAAINTTAADQINHVRAIADSRKAGP